MSNSSNKLGVVQLTIITAVNMMGSGIIMLPTKLAKIGTISVLSWLVTALGSTALAYCFAKCGMYNRKPGGMGGYSEYAFGKSGNFMANYTYAISLVIANVAIGLSAVGYGSVLLGVELDPTQTAFAVMGVLIATTVANFGGPKITGQIGSITVWGVIAPVVFVSTAGLFWFKPSVWAEAWNPHNIPFAQAVTASISMTLWAFLGLESACANSDAVENPEKNVPIAVLFGTVGCAIVYILSTNVMAGIVPNAELVLSNAPFGLVFAKMFSPMVGQIVMAAMVMACLGSLLGWQFTVANVFKSTADVGFFPKIFSKVTSKGAPIIGMTILLVVQCVLALMTMSPNLAEQFEAIVDLAVITNVIPYILSMAALPIILKISNAKGQGGILFVAFLATAYSFYALFGAGAEAMLYGGLVTFSGWTVYGYIASKFEKMSHD